MCVWKVRGEGGHLETLAEQGVLAEGRYVIRVDLECLGPHIFRLSRRRCRLPTPVLRLRNWACKRAENSWNPHKY